MTASLRILSSKAYSKVPESGGRVERHRIHVAWSPVWSFHSQWWFGLTCHMLVLVHCVFWSPQSTQLSARKFWSTSCFLLLTSFMEMLISLSSRTWHLPILPKVPKAGSITMVLLCLIGQQTRLTWTGIFNPLRLGIVKRKKSDTRPNNADDLKAAIKATWASITPEQCHRLIVSMPCRIDAVIHAKRGPTKYWVIEMNILFRSLTFLLKYPM